MSCAREENERIVQLVVNWDAALASLDNVGETVVILPEYTMAEK